MGRIKIPYYVVRYGRGYWQANAAMRAAGFDCIACGPDGPAAWARAKEMNDLWQKYKADSAVSRAPRFRRGSMAEAFAKYRDTPEWVKKAERTREEWLRAWRRIEPIFGDIAPSFPFFANASRKR